MGSILQDLCIDTLESFGEGLLTVNEYLETAEECASNVFQPTAKWRPEEVKKPWLPWSEAHVNIESEQGPSGFPKDYRLLLALRCNVARRPDGI